MDYTIRAQRWHLIGAAPLAALLAAGGLLVGQAENPADIWCLNRLAAGLIFLWWVLGTALVRQRPRPWVSGAFKAARYATRLLWGAAMAQMVSALFMLGLHALYSPALGDGYRWLDLPIACAAVMIGQAAGAFSLSRFSRPKPYLYAGTALLCAMFVLAVAA